MGSGGDGGHQFAKGGTPQNEEPIICPQGGDQKGGTTLKGNHKEGTGF